MGQTERPAGEAALPGIAGPGIAGPGIAGLRVVVTAAGQGLGRAIALAFRDAGAAVHVCDRDPDSLERLAATAPEIGATPADVADEAAVDRLFERAVAQLGGLDVLVNNAGIAGPTAEIEAIALADWRATLAVNLDGSFLCCRRAVPLLKAAGGGSIVNIASTAGLFGYPLRAPYAAAKWALVGLTETLAMELGPHGIRCNAICPGSLEGDRMDRVIAADARAQGCSEQAVKASYLQAVSLGRFIQAEEIAGMALYLCSQAGAAISGQAISVDGNTETLRG